jgi:Uma2 family endonuclease
MASPGEPGYDDAMAVEMLRQSPASPSSELGPFRKRDYLELPDEPRCELIFGRLYTTPSLTFLHQAVAGLLVLRLNEVAGRTGGAAAIAPLDVTLSDHSVVQPDVIYVSASRLGIVGERIDGAPDLVVEVLSPGTSRRDRNEKLKLYAESGVREYWIVDAIERQIEFLVSDSGTFRVALPVDDKYRSAELPEVELDLGELWRQLERDLPHPG